MKKFITIIVAFMSVLTLWGQTDSKKTIGERLNYFKESTAEILKQAITKNLVSQTDTIIGKQIYSVIVDAEYLNTNLTNIPDTLLKQEITNSLSTFCNEYYINITASNKNKIKIGTNGFLQTIKYYQKIFKELREQVKQELKQPRNNKRNNDNPTGGAQTGSKGNQDSQPEESILLHLLLILSLIVGAASITFAALSLRKVNSTDKELKKLKTKIDNIVKVDSSSKPRNNQTRNRTTYPAPATAKTEPAYPSQQPVQYNNVAVTPPPAPERKENVNKAPQETYLYANTNANGGIEFYKVTTENSGDKVFMIILRKADDENGEFTIAAMSADFMKEVIVNRDMFLPPAFCEKIIGSQNPTRIEVDTKGKAKKVGGRWQIQERMKIRLI